MNKIKFKNYTLYLDTRSFKLLCDVNGQDKVLLKNDNSGIYKSLNDALFFHFKLVNANVNLTKKRLKIIESDIERLIDVYELI